MIGTTRGLNLTVGMDQRDHTSDHERSETLAALQPRTWLLSLGAWALVAVLVTATLVHTDEHDDDFIGLIESALPAWIAYVLLTPPVLALDAWLASRRRRAWVHASALVVGGALFITLLHVVSSVVGTGVIMPWSWVIYALLVVLSRNHRRRRMLRAQELQAESLGRQLAEARVVALQSRLQPHFLFNTLHAVSATLEEDPEKARRMLVRLGDVLRSVLRLDAPEVPLSADLDLLRPYIELQSIRFGDRLRVRIEVPDALLERRVPALLLQPLVENAVTHGIAPRAAGGEIVVSAAEDGDKLVVSVCDDGVGQSSSPPPQEGIGLGSLRERVATLYGPEGSVTLTAAIPRGTCVRVVIPRNAR